MLQSDNKTNQVTPECDPRHIGAFRRMVNVTVTTPKGLGVSAFRISANDAGSVLFDTSVRPGSSHRGLKMEAVS